MDKFTYESVMMQYRIATRLTIIMRELEKISHSNSIYHLVWKEQDEESLRELLRAAVQIENH